MVSLKKSAGLVLAGLRCYVLLVMGIGKMEAVQKKGEWILGELFLCWGDKGETPADFFGESLIRQGWKVKMLDREEREGILKKQCEGTDGGKNCLGRELYVVLTDDVQFAERVFECFVPVVYYQRVGEPSTYRADLTILGVEDVDGTFLERVYLRHFGLPWEIARTERLLIRESIDADFEGIKSLYEGEETTRYIPPLSWDTGAERERFQAYIRRQYPFFGYGLYTVIENATGKVVARIGFDNREYQGKSCLELGYLVGEAWRGKGIAGEAGMALLSVMEELTGEKEVTIFCHKENTSSRRVAERLRKYAKDQVKIVLLEET